jgi:CRISPR-associated protein Csm4
MITTAFMLKCKPYAQFHFGKVALDEDTSLDDTSLIMHSDTFFSGLVNVHHRIFGTDETNKFIGELGKNIHISSAFYCLEHTKTKKRIYFLPKPLAYNLANTKGRHKELKAIEYISAGIWQAGKTAEDLLDCVVIDKHFACLPEELTAEEAQHLKIAQLNTLPKVKVRTDSPDGNIYYQTNVQIADNSALGWQVHFYVLVRSENTLPKQFETCLHVLTQTGIGGEKSTGCGALEGYEKVEDFPTLAFEEAKYEASLSLVCPDENESPLLYNPIFRGGRRLGKEEQDKKQNKYLHQVRMTLEGAIFEPNAKGRTVQLYQAENPYLRYGNAFLMPIHPNLNEYVETT